MSGLGAVSGLYVPTRGNPPLQSSSWSNMKGANLVSYYGAPPNVDPDVFDLHKEEMPSLPDTMIGKSTQLKNTFELLTLSNNTFLLTVVMPLRLTNETKFHTSSTEYIPVLPATTPFLGVTRLVQHTRNKGKFGIRRYGLGQNFEDGHLNSPEGKIHFATTLRQIQQGFIEGMQFDCLSGLINTGNQDITLLTNLKNTSGSNFRTLTENIVKNEIERWGMFQQYLSPWKAFVDHVNETTQTFNSQLFETILLPTSCEMYLRNTEFAKMHNADYVANPQTRVSDGLERVRVDAFTGKRVYTVRPFYSEGVATNPMERIAQIGEYFQATNHLLADPTDYATSYRSVQYYSQTDDAMMELTLSDMVRNCHRFDADGKLLSIRDVAVNGTVAEDATDFLHRRDNTGKLVPVLYWGDLAEKDLLPTDVSYHVGTCFAELTRNRMNASTATIEDALKVIGEAKAYAGRIPYDALVDRWANRLAFENQLFSRNEGSNKSSAAITLFSSNEHGSLRIPRIGTVNNDFSAAWTFPPTHADYGGIKTIESMLDANTYASTGFAVDYGKKLAAAIKVFDSFADALDRIYPGTPIMNPAFVTGSIQGATHRHALFENIFGLVHPSRSVFLQRVNTDPTVAGARRGQNAADIAATQARELLEYPIISKSRAKIFANYLGPLTLARGDLGGPASLGDINNIGEMIATNALNGYVFNQAAVGDTPAFALARFGGLLPAGFVEFNAAAPKPLTPDTNKDVTKIPVTYDGIARWTLLPVTTLNQAAALGFITSMVSMLKTSPSDPSRTAVILANFLDALQDGLEVSLTDVDDPANRGRVRTALDILDKRDTLDKLARIFKNFKRNPATASLFTTALTTDVIDQTKQSIESFKQQVAELESNSGSGVVSPQAPSASSYGRVLNADLDQYFPAPISLGRRAIQDYVTNADKLPGFRAIIPASVQDIAVRISTTELEIASRIPTMPSAASRLSYIEAVGIIFATPADETTVKSMIQFLPCIANSTVRESSVDELNEAEAQRQRAVQSQRTVASLPSQTALAGLLGDDPYIDNYTIPKVVKAAKFAPVASTPVERYSKFSSEDVTDELSKRASAALRKFNNQPGAQIIALAFLTTQISMNTMEAMMDHNVDIPIKFYCVRPHMEYVTNTAIAMIAGAQTCEMAFGNIMCTTGADANIQSTSLTVRMFYGPVISQQKNIGIFHNILIGPYRGGCGTGFIDPAQYRPMEGRFGERANDSFVIIAAARHDSIDGTCFHLSGRPIFSDRLGKAIDLGGTPSYGSAAYTNALFGFNNMLWQREDFAAGGSSNIFVPTDQVFTGLAKSFNPKTKRFETVSTQSGHWKQVLTYPTCARVRCGKDVANLFPMQHENGSSLAQSV